MSRIVLVTKLCSSESLRMTCQLQKSGKLKHFIMLTFNRHSSNLTRTIHIFKCRCTETTTWRLQGFIKMVHEVVLKNARVRIRKNLMACNSRHSPTEDLKQKCGDYLARHLHVTADAEPLSGASHWWTPENIREPPSHVAPVWAFHRHSAVLTRVLAVAALPAHLQAASPQTTAAPIIQASNRRPTAGSPTARTPSAAAVASVAAEASAAPGIIW
jgi:hypothetical protein